VVGAILNMGEWVSVMETGQVFVSHTSDMAEFPTGRSFVQAAMDAVGRAGMAPVDMRYFAAREGKPADYCRQRVRECEIYVAVIGSRYGSIVPGEAISYTELEFNEAGAAALPRLVFLLDSAVDLPAAQTDADRGAVAEFRQRLRDAGLIVRAFASDAGLELEVFHALTDLIRSASSGLPGTVPSPEAVRYSLPPDAAAFTGRNEELGLIIAAVTAAAGAGGVVAIHAIGGMPGIGKTALAVHVAHLLKTQFPDRQLFINLHAHTPGHDPILPEAALAGLLAAIGVDARRLPKDLDGRIGLWRDRMAGQRALLVLDNAASSDQVAPLLTEGNNCLVLVTSRRHLGDLPGPVVPLPVEVLPPGESRAMFLRLAPGAATAPASVVQELVRLTGSLPLAISLLARVYARHPSWTLGELTLETRASLLTLSAEKDSVAAAFEVSYRYLAPGQQQFFRRLGLHPGTAIDAYAAAALAGTSLGMAEEHLNALHGEGLLTEEGYRRYSMHDLIRRYALDRVTADPAADRYQRLESLLDYYQHTASIADGRLARQSRTTPASAVLISPPAAVPGLPDRTRALSWARTERANLLACIDYATRTGLHSRSVALTAAIATLLRQDGPWADAAGRHAIAVQATRHLGDRLGQANALNDLGVVRRLTGDYREAAQALEEAVRICRDLGDRLGHANALSNLGDVRYLTDDYADATQVLQEALSIYRDLNDQMGQANALSHLGIVRYLTDDYAGAALALEEALRICRDLGDRLGQANALIHLGDVSRLTSDYAGAALALEEALGICRELGDRLGQANALKNLGVVRRLTDNHPSAAQALGEALIMYRGIGDRGGEAEALNELGTLHRVSGELGRALACHQEALDLAREIRSSWDEAHALAGLGRCELDAGHTPDGKIGLSRARDIFQRIGAAEATTIAAELNALADTRSKH
jgi:tetratricopeptide (TPR) repeat protein